MSEETLPDTMTTFVLSQKIGLGLAGRMEWIDFISSPSEQELRDLATKIKAEQPLVLLALRRVTETELTL